MSHQGQEHIMHTKQTCTSPLLDQSYYWTICREWSSSYLACFLFWKCLIVWTGKGPEWCTTGAGLHWEHCRPVVHGDIVPADKFPWAQGECKCEMAARMVGTGEYFQAGCQVIKMMIAQHFREVKAKWGRWHGVYKQAGPPTSSGLSKAKHYASPEGLQAACWSLILSVWLLHNKGDIYNIMRSSQVRWTHFMYWLSSNSNPDIKKSDKLTLCHGSLLRAAWAASSFTSASWTSWSVVAVSPIRSQNEQWVGKRMS